MVVGGPGTGKTVLGILRARWLAETAYPTAREQILLTCISRPLARNLALLTDQACADTPALRSRIKVINIHALAAEVLRGQPGPQGQFSIPSEEQALQLMQEALHQGDEKQPGWRPGDYLNELRLVVLDKDITNAQQYLGVERPGRGQPLNQKQRTSVWAILERYVQLLEREQKEEWRQVINRTRRLIEATELPPPYRYRAIILDEAQDIGAAELKFLAALLHPNRELLLLAKYRQHLLGPGGATQQVPLLAHLPIVSLQTNYRTTEQIMAFATRILTAARAPGYEMLLPEAGITLRKGPAPSIHSYHTASEEETAIVEGIRSWAGSVPLEQIAVTARSAAVVRSIAKALRAAQIPITLLEEEGGHVGGVHVASLAALRGLDYQRIVIAGVSAHLAPSPKRDEPAPDPAEQERRERELLAYVVTQAREQVWISGLEPLSPLLP